MLSFFFLASKTFLESKAFQSKSKGAVALLSLLEEIDLFGFSNQSKRNSHVYPPFGYRLRHPKNF
jgi:hypothetical protein